MCNRRENTNRPCMPHVLPSGGREREEGGGGESGSLLLISHTARVRFHGCLHLHDGGMVARIGLRLRAERDAVNDGRKFSVPVGHAGRKKHGRPICSLGRQTGARGDNERRDAPDFRELFHEAALPEWRVD